jgi:hypothetical protein
MSNFDKLRSNGVQRHQNGWWFVECTTMETQDRQFPAPFSLGGTGDVASVNDECQNRRALVECWAHDNATDKWVFFSNGIAFREEADAVLFNITASAALPQVVEKVHLNGGHAKAEIDAILKLIREKEAEAASR